MQYLQKLIVAMMASVIKLSVMAPHQQQNQWLGNLIKRSAYHEIVTVGITLKMILAKADCCNEAHHVQCQDAECHGTPSATKPIAWQYNKEINTTLKMWHSA